jgi:hypothetical protein
LFGLAKKILFWSYGRTSWQYDVLCALILAFVFLTPQAWFRTGEPAATLSHQNSSKAVEKLFIPSENLPSNPGADELQRRARELTGRTDLIIKGARALQGKDGRTVAFEVDIE